MLRKYKCLPQGEFVHNNTALVPIRDSDKYAIMNWRNDQIRILRQSEPLTRPMQEEYFRNVVDHLFDKDQPDQLLFSYLEAGDLAGYGGLVHIDWKSKNAEVSFITPHAPEDERFINDWKNYLFMLKQVAAQLDLRKMYTFAYDIRPQVYTALEASGFLKEATLKDHVIIDGKFHDVVIHSLFTSR